MSWKKQGERGKGFPSSRGLCREEWGFSVKYPEERRAIVDMGKRLVDEGLTEGTGGNVSLRVPFGEGFLISPSGINYHKIEPGDVVLMGWDGNILEGNAVPSSEWELHLQAYLARSDAGGAVHTHSPYATAFSCLGKDLPPVHYLIGHAGPFVPRVPYALFGSSELARSVVPALEKSRGVLLGNHGVLGVGHSLEHAFTVVQAVEYVAEVYCHASAMGEPRILSSEQMARALERFKTYGQPRERDL